MRNNGVNMDTIKEINKIFYLAKELNKTCTLVNKYCQYNIEDEAIYNLTSITKVLENDSENLFKEICRLVDSMQEKPLPDFIYKIKPVTPEILDYDEDY